MNSWRSVVEQIHNSPKVVTHVDGMVRETYGMLIFIYKAVE